MIENVILTREVLLEKVDNVYCQHDWFNYWDDFNNYTKCKKCSEKHGLYYQNKF